MADIIARWESRSGKHWVEMDLFIPTQGAFAGVEMYGYRYPLGGGSLLANNLTEALVEMGDRVACGQFLPDNVKTLMHQTFLKS